MEDWLSMPRMVTGPTTVSNFASSSALMMRLGLGGAGALDGVADHIDDHVAEERAETRRVVVLGTVGVNECLVLRLGDLSQG